MTIVITGASGFVGRNLCMKLAKLDKPALAVSRSPAALRDAIPCTIVENYDETPAGPDDTIVHLAGESSTTAANAEGRAYVQKASKTTETLLAKQPQHFLYCSSVQVYGSRRQPMALMPRDSVEGHGAYVEGHLHNERLVLEAGGTVARLTNVIGPGMHDGTVIEDVLQQLGTEGPVTIRNAKPVRDFVWIDDVTTALMAMIARQRPGIFNIATGQGVSIGDLASSILRVAEEGHRGLSSTQSKTASDYLVLDISDTITQFGWHPKTGIEEAMRLLVHHRNKLERPNAET